MSKCDDILAAHRADQLCAAHGIGAFLFEVHFGRIDPSAVARGQRLIEDAIVKASLEMRWGCAE
jgi:hypothetical protein